MLKHSRPSAEVAQSLWQILLQYCICHTGRQSYCIITVTEGLTRIRWGSVMTYVSQHVASLRSYLFLSLLHILLYTSLLIPDLWAEKINIEKISHTNCFKTTAVSFLFAVCCGSHLLVLSEQRASLLENVFPLSLRVSCYPALRLPGSGDAKHSHVQWQHSHTSGSSHLAQKQQLPSRERSLSCTERKNVTLISHLIRINSCKRCIFIYKVEHMTIIITPFSQLHVIIHFVNSSNCTVSHNRALICKQFF